MAKSLKGSILSTLKSKASIKGSEILNGSIRGIISLKGSVVEFTRSLSIRVFVQPVANIYSKINMQRNAKANLKPRISILSKIKGFKIIKANVIQNANISIRMKAFRNLKANINVNPIFGKLTSLGLLDNKTLDDLDSQTLGEIEFTEGVVANVIKNLSINIYGVFEISATAYTLRYTTLGELDALTLGDLDTLTLQQVEEVLT